MNKTANFTSLRIKRKRSYERNDRKVFNATLRDPALRGLRYDYPDL